MKKQTSVIRRMYAGFAVMIGLFATTSTLTLMETKTIYGQLESVNTESVPLVTISSQANVELLVADKVFKDFLTTNDQNRMQQYESQFTESYDHFSQTLTTLVDTAKDYPSLSSQLEALTALEGRYFTQAQVAMSNYRDQLAANEARQQSIRRFQQLHRDLNVRMKDVIADRSRVSELMLAKSYFDKLSQTEAITSDALASSDVEKINEAIKNNKRLVNHLSNSYRTLTSMIPDLKRTFDSSIDQYNQDIGQSGGVLDVHFNYIQAQERLYTSISNLAAEINNANSLLESFRSQARDDMNMAIAQAGESYQTGVRNTVLLGSLAAFLAVVIGWFLARNVRQPLASTLTTLEALTAGDMTKRITDNKYAEFGQLSHHINTLADHLQQLLSQLSDASAELTEVATQNQTTTADAKDRLNEQRQQTASVATAMTEMEHSVAQVTQSAQHTLDKVKNVESAAATGRGVMGRNISTTHQLSEQLDQSVQAVNQLQQMSSNIGSILDVIRTIADQTNLLALNAAIEAARAGEQGRGFAVVADEVRILAQRTTASTGEIESMIQELQSSSSQAVQVIESCVNEMEDSVNQTSEASSAMEEIEAIIIEISDMSSQIVQATEEQRSTTASIARSLEDISEIADANLAAMESVTSASLKLDLQAKEQNALVQRFTL
ncbi:methyl-accepting chemotaxis protein [Photobacterium sp. WH77]|uniref:methyl-accepting chemotaxis protein n=1 Tax=Photobacterium TaxID=657 RepID=UPI001EDA331E|nr:MULTISPECIES: methyl-accepting chemotaxis protein [Photobacterium]MCG2838541.1 methyl-accepting chemotaxis protein [Photobacterium sp. WH77]MCG2846087.1 methyl-accepting chemotaxis protein [Photobacterium sp. WH80]MDO6580105.1 methyl-accepting chemotaxis protein [Photobacterium sp. 2_MG-2023]